MKVGIWSMLSSSFMAFCALLFFAYLVDLASFIPSPMLGFCILVWGAALGIDLPIGEVEKFGLIILVKLVGAMVLLHKEHSTSVLALAVHSFPPLTLVSSSSGNTQSSLVNLEACIISTVQCHLADFQGPMDEKFCNDIDFWNHAEVCFSTFLCCVLSKIMYQQQGQTESVGSKKLFIPGAWSQLDGQTNKKNTEKHGICNQATNSKQ
ncbi:hypothetical protein F5J12DRAFT_784491 [Pisolithus orientalis]|uniref:uncharacterized protein n=1 Tax=Pisolithus orientalis TaxID=936130 RepID=UPI0022244869|nr:uncharacterized protein F5J12DRAFT_784491 [Pisolithus orientalis]KAI6000182.1 hypothetical protein F5J12DRAFT_784491 [Pisolithus orientalis]